MVELVLDRLSTDVQQTGNFTNCFAFNPAQNEYCAASVGKGLVDSFYYLFFQQFQPERVFRIVVDGQRWSGNFILVSHSHILALPVISQRIHTDGNEVRKERALWLEAGSVLPHTDERLLDNLLSEICVLRFVPEVPEENRLVRMKKEFKRTHV